MNVFNIECLRSLVEVSRMDIIINVGMCRRAGMKGELASAADYRVLRWFGCVERMDEEGGYELV